MKEIIEVLDNYNPTHSFLFMREIVRMAQVPVADASEVTQRLLDKLREEYEQTP